MDAVKRYHERRNRRLKKEERLDSVAAYRLRRAERLLARFDDDEEKNGASHGNTRIPFGLCEREGIKIGEDWSPKDAWDALTGKGYSANEVYSVLKKTGKIPEKKEKPTRKRRSAIKIGGDSKEFHESLEKAKKKIINLEGKEKRIQGQIFRDQALREIYAEFPKDRESAFWNKEEIEKDLEKKAEYLEKSKAQKERYVRNGEGKELLEDAEWAINHYQENVDYLQEKLDIIKEYDETGRLTKLNAVLKEIDDKIAGPQAEIDKAKKQAEKLRQDIKDGINARLPNVDACKSVKDVQEYLNNKGYFGPGEYTGNRDIDMRFIQLENAKDIASAMDNLFGKYPKLMGKFPPIRHNGGLPDSTFAQTNIMDCQVEINLKMFSDDTAIKANYDEDIRKKFHPPTGNQVASIVLHEYGHAIDVLLSEKRGALSFSQQVAEKCYKKFGDENGVMSESKIMNELSSYAAQNDAEFLAEAFGEYMESKSPRPIAKYVGDLVEEEMRKQGYL